jgi:isonocardicin synthase
MNGYNNETAYTYEQMEELEKTIYKEKIISNNEKHVSVNLKKILNRETVIFYDREYNLPQNIFIIKKYRGKIIVGRKLLSTLRIKKQINAINCSMITASMILGVLKKRKKDGKKISIEYYPLSNGEKLSVFEKIKQDLTCDIYYPYKYRDFKNGKEEISPKDGWKFNPDRKEYLGYGEHHIREYTKSVFKNIDLDKKNVYDPACSTGEFLSAFQQSFPKCKTIGHDLSREMINYAKDYVNEAYCCNALNSPLKNNSIDIMFLRFLNSEVVSTRMAYKIMNKLIEKMKKQGLIICFGHTPVLIKREWFIKHGLNIINCIGYDEKEEAIFQYYVLEVEKK